MNSEHNSRPAESMNDEIARLAYSFFESEGRLEGHDLEHWLCAEKQLARNRPSGKKTQKNKRSPVTPIRNWTLSLLHRAPAVK